MKGNMIMYEDLVETKLACEKIFDGTLLHVRRDTVRLPNGKDAVREWIMHPGAAAVLPILPKLSLSPSTVYGTADLAERRRYFGAAVPLPDRRGDARGAGGKARRRR